MLVLRAIRSCVNFFRFFEARDEGNAELVVANGERDGGMSRSRASDNNETV